MMTNDPWRELEDLDEKEFIDKQVNDAIDIDIDFMEHKNDNI